MTTWTEMLSALPDPPRVDDETVFLDRVARNMVHYRVLCKLTQAQLSTKSDIDRGTIANLESGKRRPTVTTLYRLAQAMDIPIRLFFE